ncbi:MAG TPA: hypothetical protein VN848_02540 [Gemmatimonadales bacterium]|nr:hypothetical protein [Gemmatimonadales bacterium]
MRVGRWVVALLASAGTLGGCSNAGQDRILAVQGTGIVNGFLYFDRNGDGSYDAGDTVLTGVAVHLIVSGTVDTVGSAKSDTAGLVRFALVPAGPVTFTVDSTTLPVGGLHVLNISAPSLVIAPGDSFGVRVRASYLQLGVPQARTVAAGTKVFVVGVALNPANVFGDSTVHMADTLAAILVTRVRGLVSVGDSIRWLAVRSTRNGQPTLDNPTLYPLGQAAATPALPVAAAVAAAAQGGAIDAALVQLTRVTVADTATVAGNLHLTVKDNSGTCTVQLDTVAGFRGFGLAADTVGDTLNVTGVLSPNGSGAWIVLPRSTADVVPQ